MIDGFSFKERYNCEDLFNIVAVLRAPGGCPWDAEQTHESIKKNFIEETYEVIEAINKKDSALLCEELGDVLLQIALHCRMEEEKNSFNFDDVCDEICKKLIVRHPHVFGDISVSSTEEVLKNWDEIKMRTKSRKSAFEAMSSIPRELPALMRSQKIQQKAANAGFDWDSASGALEKLHEEADEVASALKNADQEEIQDEIGDLLFSIVNVARFAGVDAEEALTGSADKFLSRFALVEKLAKKRGIDMKKADIAQLDELWDEAKNIIKNSN